MKKSFIQTANKIVKDGDRFLKKNGSAKFHEMARELLVDGALHHLFNYEELVQYVFNKKFKTEQNFKSLEFSDLPITIARGSDCFIDIYFWRRRPTVIHNHHFQGAFQCLLGRNLDSEFKFKVNKKLTKFHDLGELSLIHTRELNAGDVVSINLLNKFIHQNHHHADLTVNLCFRTSEVPKKNLSNYLYSGLRFEKDPESLARVDRLNAFLRMDDFSYTKLDLNLIDALNFLILTYRSGIENPRLIKLQRFLDNKIKSELKLDIKDLLDKHEHELDRIQSLYE